MYPRLIQESINQQLFQGKTIIVLGARQVGKTTIVKQIYHQFAGKKTYIDCDLIRNIDRLSKQDEHYFADVVVGDHKLVIIDEAQRVKNIGINIKILHDYFPDVQFIITGSSSLDIVNQIHEPLTGRSLTYQLFPLSADEMSTQSNYIDIADKLQSLLIYGSYPDIVNTLGVHNKQKYLENLVSNYLTKDILIYDGIKKSDLIINLLKYLALQIGSEVNIHELAQKLGISKPTVEKYIDLLEKTFVIFRLSSYHTNPRKELSKSKKIYFWDLGVRNALLGAYTDLDQRSDLGNLRENRCMSEKYKSIIYHGQASHLYFWRTYNQQEIDLIEISHDMMYAYEIKRNASGNKITRSFTDTYPHAIAQVIDPESISKLLRSSL